MSTPAVGGPRVSTTATTRTAETTSSSTFNPTDYLTKKLADTQGFVDSLGKSYADSFTTKVKDAVAKLGPNATAAQIDKAVSSELSNQLVAKSVVDMASRQIMDRVKEMSGDTFQSE